MSENTRLKPFGKIVFSLALLVQGQAEANGIADFNNDGYDDLAIGSPGENVGDISDAGAVNIVYGGPQGQSALPPLIWHRDVSGVQGVAAAYEEFGFALATGDFNGDSFGDLAIGVPGQWPGGAVQVLYGDGSGLRQINGWIGIWTQNSEGIKGNAEANDRFGSALAVGDFDGDGFDDLAVGVPEEDIESRGYTDHNAGAVNVIYGSNQGLSIRDQIWYRGQDGILGIRQYDDRFGYALTSGDFDGDGYDDLGIGVPAGGMGNVRGGEVNILYGGPSSWPPLESEGLSEEGDQIWHQNVTDIIGLAENKDLFGASLAAGDFNCDGRDDLAIGVPYESVVWGNEGYEYGEAGAVNIIYGGGTGLNTAQNRLWHQGYGLTGLPSTSEEFGAALAAGNFDNDPHRCADLAIGVPGEAWNSTKAVGAVNVMYGNPQSGLGPAGNQFFSPGQHPLCGTGGCTPGFQGNLQEMNFFGRALAALDFDGNGYDDLAVGIPGRTIQGFEGAGMAMILDAVGGGSSVGLSWANAKYLSQGNLPGVTESGDRFGASLGW